MLAAHYQPRRHRRTILGESDTILTHRRQMENQSIKVCRLALCMIRKLVILIKAEKSLPAWGKANGSIAVILTGEEYRIYILRVATLNSCRY